MLHIQKGPELQFMTDFKKKYPTKNYGSKEFAPYREELNSVLCKEQKGLCAYCCGRITSEKSHNEHIEPQNPGKYASARTLDYDNIVASCNNARTCGLAKENQYDAERFVSPLDEDCEKKFTYYANGKIDGDAYTISLLNLNDYELRNARKAVVRGLQGLDKETVQMIYMDETQEEYPPYYNVIKWYWETM